MWRGDCHPRNPTAGCHESFVQGVGGGEDKKRERRESGKKCGGGYARMCGIKDCPEVDLCFQGTGMNGWLVSAVYHNDEGLIETRKQIFIIISYITHGVSQLTKVLGKFLIQPAELWRMVLCTLYSVQC